MDVKAPSGMKLEGNLAENWTRFKQRFLLHLEATEKIAKPDKLKVALLLGTMGEECIDIYNSFKLSDEDSEVFVKVLEQFDQYFKPKRNTVIARYKFFNCKQAEGETIDSFVTNLKILAKDCEFNEQEDSLIRDLLIIGVKDLALKEKLLMESDLSLIKAIEFCRAKESSVKQVKIMNGKYNAEVEVVYGANKRKINKAVGSNFKHENFKHNGFKHGNFKREDFKQDNFKRKNFKQKVCGKCKSMHEYGRCPAFGKICFKCKKLNHFSSACRNTRVGELRGAYCDSDTDDSLKLESVSGEIHTVKTEWREVVLINNIKVPLKIDTGAEVNVLPVKLFNAVKCTEVLFPTKRILKSYTGHDLRILGTCKFDCKVGNKSVFLEFYIVDQESNGLLGLEASEKLGFISRSSVDLITSSKLVAEFSDVFSEKMGKLSYTYKIKLEENVKPKIVPPRVIPFSLRDKVKDEISKMLKQGVLERATEPSDWVHPIVIVQKPNKQVRICMDPRTLNKYIKREHYPIPTQQSIFSQIEGAKYFTVLDASSAFLQIPLDKESSDLCTIGTPFGRFKFCRLPYGLSSSPEVYQKTIDCIFSELEGVLTYIDDILIFGRSEQEHDTRLEAVLNRARKSGLKLSLSKSQIKQSSVKYLGYNLTSKGISLNETKVEAITKYKVPENKRELQRFLGMITYLGKFIPNLSDKTGILRKILSARNEFVWTENEQKAFEELKNYVIHSPVLSYFNPKLKSVLSVDASQYGLGAVLLQNDHPIAYGSTALSDTQQRYSQIEKELLAILIGCKKFHYYLYATNFVIETDHKPLIGLLQKPLENLSPRLQRMTFDLLKYRFKLIHVPGKKLYVADALSRCPINSYVDTSFLEKEAATVHTVLSASEEKVIELKRATEEDLELMKLKSFILHGWPKQFKQIPEGLRAYWNKREELNFCEGLLFFGSTLIIPKQLRNYVLSQIHSAHQGIVSCQRKARNSVYWPNIMKDIQNYVESCHICQGYQRANRKEPIIFYKVPSVPWEEVGVDFMYIDGEDFLLLVDYFSKFIEVRKLQNKTATSVISALKQIFRTHGLPRVFHSDNGPPFDSFLFLKFLKQYDIKSSTSSPKYSCSNGMVERSIETMKSILFKVKKAQGDRNLAVIEYNNTPKENLPSPSEMLMGRLLRTLLPVKASRFESNFTKDFRSRLCKTQQKQKFYDRSKHVLPELKPKQPVYIQMGHRKWVPGVVQNKHESPRSYIVKSSAGADLRRNRIHLRERKDFGFHGDSRSRGMCQSSGSDESTTDVNRPEQSSDAGESSFVGTRHDGLKSTADTQSSDASPCPAGDFLPPEKPSDAESLNIPSAPSQRPRRITKRPSYLKDYVCS